MLVRAMASRRHRHAMEVPLAVAKVTPNLDEFCARAVLRHVLREEIPDFARRVSPR